MHELSIAYSIVEIVNEEARKANATKVSEVELEVGTLSGVEVEALEFAMEASIKDTIMKDAEVRIIKRQARAHCNNCENDFECVSLFDPCPKCNGFENEITQGREMNVKSLVVE